MDLRDVSLMDRKKILEALLRDVKAPLAYSEHFETDGAQLFRQACSMQIEGLVSKRKDGKYLSGRVPQWMKMTCRERETFVIAGLAFKGEKFDGVYLGRKTEDGLLYAGKVENGFSDAVVRRRKARAMRLKLKKSPLVAKPKATWLQPRLLADVEFRAVTGTGKLRHPSFKECARTYDCVGYRSIATDGRCSILLTMLCPKRVSTGFRTNSTPAFVNRQKNFFYK